MRPALRENYGVCRRRLDEASATCAMKLVVPSLRIRSIDWLHKVVYNVPYCPHGRLYETLDAIDRR